MAHGVDQGGWWMLEVLYMHIFLYFYTVQFKYSFLHLPVLLTDKITHKQRQNSFTLKLFPNISVVLRQIHSFKTIAVASWI